MNRLLIALFACSIILTIPAAAQTGPFPGGSMDYAGPFPPGLAPAAGFLVKPSAHGVPVDLTGTSSLATADNCGANIYFKKCTHCFIMVGLKTEEQCKEVAGLIEWNREVLERALCRLSQYEEWEQEADEKSKEALGDFLEQVKDNLPGIGDPVNMKTLAGKMTFVGRVADLMQMQVSLLEFLGNSQGSSVFTGMLRPVKREVSSVSKELRKEIAWYERNCPPPEEDQPMDLLPPEYISEDVPDEPKEQPAETPPGETITLDEYEDDLIDRNALKWQLDFNEDLLPVDSWIIVLSDLQPFGIVGFVRGLNRGAWAGRLHPVNLMHAREALDLAFAQAPRGLEARFLEPDFFAPIEDTSIEDWGPKDPVLSNERVGGSGEEAVPQHGLVRLMPGSEVRGEVRYDARAQEDLITLDGQHTVDGPRWYGDYDILDANGRADTHIKPMHILAEYDMEAERLGGEVTNRTQNRIEFRVPGPTGRGSTWVKVWASEGRYTLTVIDE